MGTNNKKKGGSMKKPTAPCMICAPADSFHTNANEAAIGHAFVVLLTGAMICITMSFRVTISLLIAHEMQTHKPKWGAFGFQ